MENKKKQEQTSSKYSLGPASPEEAGLFYAQTPERDEELGTIGHVRIDFGYRGREFHHSWWPRGPEELNTPEFREELGQVVDDLRESVLKDLSSMRRFCREQGGIIADGWAQNYGYVLETDRYLYRLRCNPVENDYQCYLTCCDKQAQTMQKSQIVGRISFADGTQMDFTDPEKYIQAIQEELPYQATTGFRCETLTDDPEICKAVDDIICDFYDEESPRQLEEQREEQNMTFGGGM